MKLMLTMKNILTCIFLYICQTYWTLKNLIIFDWFFTICFPFGIYDILITFTVWTTILAAINQSHYPSTSMTVTAYNIFWFFLLVKNFSFWFFQYFFRVILVNLLPLFQLFFIIFFWFKCNCLRLFWVCTFSITTFTQKWIFLLKFFRCRVHKRTNEIDEFLF